MIKRQCIYAIINSLTGKSYVGSTKNYGARSYTHLSMLRRGTHHAVHLQRAWGTHGGEVFWWVVLEDVAALSDLIEREQYWIDRLDSYKNGYNCAPIAGRPVSAGKPHTPETIAKMKALRVLRPPITDETRARMSAGQRTRTHSVEVRLKISISGRGKKRSPEQCANISAALKGKPKDNQQTGRKRSVESRARMAEAQRRSWAADGARRK